MSYGEVLCLFAVMIVVLFGGLFFGYKIHNLDTSRQAIDLALEEGYLEYRIDKKTGDVCIQINEVKPYMDSFILFNGYESTFCPDDKALLGF